jgi:formate hydrogenlyase subunit 6/NADH:ubiquinone oxidoreductase subunit I
LSTYFKNISEGIQTTVKGMRITLRHLWQARKRRKITDIRSARFYDTDSGMVTIQYPQETIAIPDNGRYRLHNEMDDCIVCDKCVKVCPVDCIEIEPIRAIGEVGKASDGSPIRLYAAKFDIDMAKCCYCGLCTTVCPTECLTMTKTFDYSELDIRDMVYNYGNLTPEEANEKRLLLEQFQKEKEALKAASAKPPVASEQKPATARPAFKPSIKPKVLQNEPSSEEQQAALEDTNRTNPSEDTPVVAKEASRAPFRPVMKPKAERGEEVRENTETSPKEKPAFRPVMKPKTANPAEKEAPERLTSTENTSKPAFRPTMKPKAEITDATPLDNLDVPPVKPAFRPTMKPKTEDAAPAENPENTGKPAFRPTMKPKAEITDATPLDNLDVPPVKPAFRPTMKPKTEDAAPAENPENASKPAFRPTMKPKADRSITDPSQENIAQKSEEKPETTVARPTFRPTMKPKPKQDE